jgi:hypothetical protein
MPTIPVPAGLTQKELIDRAYTGLGFSDSMFGRTQEEYAAGQELLRAMMGEWPYDQLGFDDVETALTAETAIERKWLNVVGLGLGEMLSTTTGKQLSPTFQKLLARSYSRLCGAVAVMPEVALAGGTVLGSGNRRAF